MRRDDGTDVIVRAPGEIAARPGARFAAHASRAMLHVFDTAGVSVRQQP
jgi:hypothetical protein